MSDKIVWNFNHRIHYRRTTLKLSIRQCTKVSSIKAKRWREIEDGDNPSRDEIVEMAYILKCPIFALRTGELYAADKASSPTSQYIRYKDGAIELATVTLGIGKDLNDHRISVFGVMHVADKAYYEWVQKYLDNRVTSGGVVHYEGIRPTNDMTRFTKFKVGFINLMTPKPQAKRPKETSTSLEEGFDNEELVLQQDVMVYNKPDWFIADVTATALFSNIKLTKMIWGLLGLIMEGRKQPDYPNTRAMMLDAVSTPEKLTKEFTMLDSVFPTKDILNYRNYYAAATAAQTMKNVSMLWGASHVPGIVDELVQYGYTVVKVHWHVALSGNMPISNEVSEVTTSGQATSPSSTEESIHRP